MLQAFIYRPRRKAELNVFPFSRRKNRKVGIPQGYREAEDICGVGCQLLYMTLEESCALICTPGSIFFCAKCTRYCSWWYFDYFPQQCLPWKQKTKTLRGIHYQTLNSANLDTAWIAGGHGFYGYRGAAFTHKREGTAAWNREHMPLARHLPQLGVIFYLSVSSGGSCSGIHCVDKCHLLLSSNSILHAWWQYPVLRSTERGGRFEMKS